MAEITYTKEQREVIDLRHANLIVSAAAGSGKTAVLTARILSLLTDPEEPIDIDRMLIVTFTKAAAAEMRERIGRAIEAYSAEHPEDSRMERQGTLLHNAQITTIDSFCLWVVREHFSEIRLDPGFRILDEGERELLFQDVQEELLEEEYAARREDFLCFIESYCTDGREEAALTMLRALYDFAMSHPQPERWLREAAAEEQLMDAPEERRWYAYLARRAGEQIAYLKKTAEEALRLCRDEAGPAAYLAQAEALWGLAESLADHSGHEARHRLLSNLALPGLKSGKKKNEDPEMRARAKELLSQCKQVAEELAATYAESVALLGEEQALIAPAASALVRLTLELARRFDAAKRERNVLDFQDMEHFALRILLREEEGRLVPSAAAEEYREYFAQVCVDEYQDSNYVQEYILKSVAREDAYFMVGDVKQSIYRFRLARPEIFLKKYASSGESGSDRRMDLNRNFRSRREVIDFVNTVFSRLMRQETAGMEYDERARLYPGAAYPEAEDTRYQTELLVLDATQGVPEGVELGGEEEDAEEEPAEETGNGRRMSRTELEAWLAADRIRALVQEQYPVWDRAAGEYRPIRYRDIVLLARSAKAYESALKSICGEYGIPLYTGAQTGYFQTREIRLMMNVLRVIDNPMQDIPLYDVLTAYLGCFDEEGMALLRGRDASLALYPLLQQAAEGEDEAREPARRFFGWLTRYRAMAKYLTVRELLERLLMEGHYLDEVSAMPGGAQRRANLLALLDRAGDYERTSYRGLFSFVRYITRMKESQIDYGEVSILDESADVVRLMTIHKSKGLEFPVCICLGLSKRFELRERADACRMDTELGIAMDPIDLDKRVRRSGLKRRVLAQKAREDALAEEQRILYVALTRAMEKLILTDVELKEAKLGGEPPAPEPYTILHSSCAMQWIRMALQAEGTLPVHTRRMRIEELSERIVSDTARAAAGSAALYARELPVDPALAEALRTARERQYAHPELSGLYTKTTVSELKRAAYADEEAWEQFTHEEREAYVPRFIRPSEEGYAGARRGSAYHRYLELLELERSPEGEDAAAAGAWLEAQGAAMVRRGALPSEDAALLSYPKLLRFLTEAETARMRQAARAGQLHREQAFFIGVPATELDAGFPAAAETIIVQGVIDAYWEEGEELVLLDYKTDRVTQEEELLRRYRAQLAIYARALEQITGRRVRESLIYSFALEKYIIVTSTR